MSVILDGFTTFFGTRQKDQESLQDYTIIFKTSYEVLKSHIGGPIQIQKFVKTLNGFKDDPDNEYGLLTNEKLTKQARDQFVSFVYLQNADHSKYRSILKILNYQKSLRNDQYHKKMLEATNVLSNNWYDNANQRKHQNK